MYRSYVFSFSLFFPVTVFVCDFYSCNFFFHPPKKSHSPLIFIYRYCNSNATYHHLFFTKWYTYYKIPLIFLNLNFAANPQRYLALYTSCGYSPFCNNCNKQPSQATANPISGKACSSTKGGFTAQYSQLYSLHKVSSF